MLTNKAVVTTKLSFFPFRVLSNIRFLAKWLIASSVMFSAIAYSQNTDDVEPSASIPQEQTAQEAPAQDASSPQTILRLEDTIRGNKEQPQVLTIVPWQLPVHQRISENEQWGLQVNQLSSIERNAFLRRLAVVKEIKAVQAAQEQE